MPVTRPIGLPPARPPPPRSGCARRSPRQGGARGGGACRWRGRRRPLALSPRGGLCAERLDAWRRAGQRPPRLGSGAEDAPCALVDVHLSRARPRRVHGNPPQALWDAASLALAHGHASALAGSAKELLARAASKADPSPPQPPPRPRPSRLPLSSGRRLDPPLRGAPPLVLLPRGRHPRRSRRARARPRERRRRRRRRERGRTLRQSRY